MEPIELITLLESPKFRSEMESCALDCASDQWKRNGQMASRDQLVDWMLARLRENVRGLGLEWRQAEKLSHWLDHSLPEFQKLVEETLLAGGRPSVAISNRIAEEIRRTLPLPPKNAKDLLAYLQSEAALAELQAIWRSCVRLDLTGQDLYDPPLQVAFRTVLVARVAEDVRCMTHDLLIRFDLLEDLGNQEVVEDLLALVLCSDRPHQNHLSRRQLKAFLNAIAGRVGVLIEQEERCSPE